MKKMIVVMAVLVMNVSCSAMHKDKLTCSQEEHEELIKFMERTTEEHLKRVEAIVLNSQKKIATQKKEETARKSKESSIRLKSIEDLQRNIPHDELKKLSTYKNLLKSHEKR